MNGKHEICIRKRGNRRKHSGMNEKTFRTTKFVQLQSCAHNNKAIRKILSQDKPKQMKLHNHTMTPDNKRDYHLKSLLRNVLHLRDLQLIKNRAFLTSKFRLI